jgi:hypothetical protein
MSVQVWAATVACRRMLRWGCGSASSCLRGLVLRNAGVGRPFSCGRDGRRSPLGRGSAATAAGVCGLDACVDSCRPYEGFGCPRMSEVDVHPRPWAEPR